jgi:DNA-binding NarL/FixJ family response regulator
MTIVAEEGLRCAILADGHSALADRLRDLLRAVSDSVVTVADSQSLLVGARRLRPDLIVVDLAFGQDGLTPLLHKLKADVPAARLIVLSLYEEPEIARSALANGADAIVLKRDIGDDLLEAIDRVLSGATFVSPGFLVYPQH